MKTFKLLFLIGVLCGLLTSCNKDEATSCDDDLLKSAQPVTVTLPFDATFLGTYVDESYPGDENYTCDLLYECHVVVDVVGTATHMGKITGTFDFCACGPDDPDIPGLDWQYAPTETALMAANGDILIVTCSGSVIAGHADDQPDYINSYWRDEFLILGGTGRFEGATGGGMTDDFNSDLDNHSHHHWTGSITLIKGK